MRGRSTGLSRWKTRSRPRGRSRSCRTSGGSGTLFGFFNKESRGWRTPNSLAFRLDGNGGKAWVFYEYGTRNWLTGGGGCFEGEQYQKTPTKPMPADGKPHAWSLVYDPRAAGGRGEITFTLDGKPAVLDLKPGAKDRAPADRFGIVTWKTGGHHVVFSLDDITYTARPVTK